MSNNIVGIFGNKQNEKEFEDIFKTRTAKDFFAKYLSQYGADQIAYLRWATTDPTGRHALYFKKSYPQSEPKLKYDSDGELISIIWYNLYLENREHYLTERAWMRMLDEGNKKVREHFVINFDGLEGTSSPKEGDKAQPVVFTFSSNFLSVLDKNGKMRKRLLNSKAKNKKIIISPTNILPKVREIRAEQKVLNWQREGIRKALELWLINELLRGELNRCFNLFYPKKEARRDKVSEFIPIFRYELASQFLFMFQNIAVFCPEVRVLHLFSYISANRKRKSALVFFYKKNEKQKNLIFHSHRLFDLLADVESAAPNKKEDREQPDTVSFPLWSSAFSRIPEKKEKDKKKNETVKRTG